MGPEQGLCGLQVIELPGASKDGTAEQHVFALVSPDASPVIQPLPDTAAARQLLKKQPLFFWRHNPVTGEPCCTPSECSTMIVIYDIVVVAFLLRYKTSILNTIADESP